jgi:hydrogenase nickel incorporation protein HypA/HybF
MHELGITQSILSIALHHAKEAGAARITTINLVIGELSSIVDESVQFYWEMIAKGTIAENAVLNFKRVPANLRCDECGHQFPLGSREAFTCPACGSDRVRVASGEDFYLESIDVDFEAELENE